MSADNLDSITSFDQLRDHVVSRNQASDTPDDKPDEKSAGTDEPVDEGEPKEGGQKPDEPVDEGEPEGDPEEAPEGGQKPDDKPDESKPSRANRRIRALTDKVRDAHIQIDNLARQLSEAQAREQEIISKLGNAKVVNKEDFDNVGDYVEAITSAKVEASVGQALASQAKATTESLAKKYEEEIGQAFVTKCEAVKDEIPDIYEAATHLSKVGLPPEIRKAMLIDEHAARIVYDVATDKDKINILHNSDPVAAIKYIARMSAAYDDIDDETPRPSSKAPVTEAYVPKAKPRAPVIPKPKGPGHTSLDSMTPEQAWIAYKQGKIKVPFYKS